MNMINDNKTTFATIAYKGDLRMLLLQMLSIDRLFDINQIKEHLIILNMKEEERNGNYTDLMYQILKTSLSKLYFLKVKIILSSELLTLVELERSEGQRSQQILKLRASKIVDTETYILLDAKNIFLRPTSLSDFIDGNGKFFTKISKVQPQWEDYVEQSFDILGVAIDDCIKNNVMPTITPYVMITNATKELVSELEKIGSGNINVCFEKKHGKITEFFLYFAYLIKTNQIDCYQNVQFPCLTFFASYPSEYSLIQKFLDDIQDKKHIFMVGLHKKRLPQLSREHFNTLNHIFRERFLNPWEQLDWFLDWENQHSIERNMGK